MNRAAWLVAATLALGGCVAVPRAPDGAAAPDPAALRQWSAAGRMAIAAGEEGGNGSFSWQQDEATTRLDLRGPLGSGGVRLVMAPESLSLTDGSGRVLDSAAARAELQARLGTDLPWGELRYWMLGLAAPGETAVVQESATAPWRVIEQSEWRVAYDSFVTVRGVNLPQRFSAQRGAVRLRVVVDSWSTGQ